VHELKSIKEIGMKITAAQREFRRYTGISAQLERCGLGSSRPDLAWARRCSMNREGDHPVQRARPVMSAEMGATTSKP
jgi:hypothetical protein